MKIRVQFLLSLSVILSALTFSASAQQVNDAQLKTNATPINNSLSYINRLQPVTYQYNHNDYKQLNLPTGLQVGFIANDAKQVAPWAITTSNNWYNAGKGSQRAVSTSEVDLQKLVPLLVGAVKEQQAEIEKLKQEVQQLKQSR
ncbi:tail fiber domain-containing protein [Mucilaginibacter phyllosphaerae]